MTHKVTWSLLAALALLGAAGGSWYVLSDRRGEEARVSSPVTGAPAMAGMDMLGDRLALSAEQRRTFGVVVATAALRSLADSIQGTGVVMLDESRVVAVVARLGGYVESVRGQRSGAHVRRGDALVEINSPELRGLHQELLLAHGLRQSADTDAVDLEGAARRRLVNVGVPASEIERTLRTGVAPRLTAVASPADGVLVDKLVTSGAAVVAGQVLYTIADLGVVWLEGAFPAVDAATLREGLWASIAFEGVGVPVTNARVSMILPSLDLATRTVRTRFVLPNPGLQLKPGSYATVTLALPSRRALTVPTSAIVRTGRSTLVFVDMPNGELLAHEVVVGVETAEFTEILSGIAVGDQVVTSAQYLIDAESNLGDAMRSMMRMGSSRGAGPSMQDIPGMDMKGMDMKGMDMKGMDMKGMDMKGMDAKGADMRRPQRDTGSHPGVRRPRGGM